MVLGRSDNEAELIKENNCGLCVGTWLREKIVEAGEHFCRREINRHRIGLKGVDPKSSQGRADLVEGGEEAELQCKHGLLLF